MNLKDKVYAELRKHTCEYLIIITAELQPDYQFFFEWEWMQQRYKASVEGLPVEENAQIRCMVKEILRVINGGEIE